jgi:hypothetical protein
MYAETIYYSGFQTQYIQTELKLLAIYFRDMLKLGLNDRKQALYDFCEKHYPHFNRLQGYAVINRAVTYSRNGARLIDIPYINVYKTDIEYLDAQPLTYDQKKLLFTFIVFMRLNGEYLNIKNGTDVNYKIFRGGREQYNRIYKMAGFKSKSGACENMLHELSLKGYVTPIYRGGVVMNFLDTLPVSADIAFDISDYDNIGLYYDLYNGVSNIGICAECGRAFRKNSNRQSYCSQCVHHIRKSQHKEYMRNWRAQQTDCAT